MFHVEQFKKLIIEPALYNIGLWSESATNLLVGTALIESNLKYFKQVPQGPALGLFQIESATYQDICNRSHKYPEIRNKALKYLGYKDFPERAYRLISDIALSVIIARLKYYLHPSSLPPSDDIPALAEYWNTIYNTNISLEKQYLFAGLYKKYCINL